MLARAVLSRSGKLLGMYNLGQAPQGHDALREFVARKAARRSGIACGPEDVLITSGSLQGMDLVNTLFIAPGDTVIIEEFTYGGAIAKVQRLGGRIVGAPLDEGGIVIPKLRAILERFEGRRDDSALHLHHPHGAEPDRLDHEPRAAPPASRSLPRVRRADLRGRMLCRPRLVG